jgi:hypothetical protein
MRTAASLRCVGSPLGVVPVALRKAALNELVSLNPSDNPISVIDLSRFTSSSLATSMRRFV